ncbi:flagellar basal body P-ring formation chaperone FlgA [Phaeovulum sp. W22_SRMD_FR3]|uniref:flagellar basal body P-ring formation chaperone FlgA n=1 Tax=Phaeovulum sp. W22_SRMD_FR3 TaxID=3240274 RepID=UPI003F9DF365
MFACLATGSRADVLIASHTLRPQTTLTAEDLEYTESDAPGALSAEDVIGMETKVSIYAKRPIRLQDIGPAAVVERNQTVPLIYHKGTLTILTEGRAMQRAGVGEIIKVMNIASKTTVTARVDPDGTLQVFSN